MHQQAIFYRRYSRCVGLWQVKGALKELKGSVGQLLLGKRAGVVVALAAAVGGTPAAEKELSDTIVSALEQHRPAAQADGMVRVSCSDCTLLLKYNPGGCSTLCRWSCHKTHHQQRCHAYVHM